MPETEHLGTGRSSGPPDARRALPADLNGMARIGIGVERAFWPVMHGVEIRNRDFTGTPRATVTAQPKTQLATARRPSRAEPGLRSASRNQNGPGRKPSRFPMRTVPRHKDVSLFRPVWRC